MSEVRSRFRITEFINPGTDSVSWRVSGSQKDGTRIRENFASLTLARSRALELEGLFLGAQPREILRPTSLSLEQLRLAEALFANYPEVSEIHKAMAAWKQNGGQQVDNGDIEHLDSAVAKFHTWLETAPYRPRSRHNLKYRIQNFRDACGELCLDQIDTEFVESYLESRKTTPVSRDNDRRALSRFFSWCIERPRRWMASNPARDIRIKRRRDTEPAILKLRDVQKILVASKRFRSGRWLPYVAMQLFGGLRPTEVSRMKWDLVNFRDMEIRLPGAVTKTGKSRPITVRPVLAEWLKLCKGQPFLNPQTHRVSWDDLRRKAGLLGRWPDDVLRHTAITHFFRSTGSYGLTAEWSGNSEPIIKRHYQGRASSEDSARYWNLFPQRQMRKANRT